MQDLRVFGFWGMTMSISYLRPKEVWYYIQCTKVMQILDIKSRV